MDIYRYSPLYYDVYFPSSNIYSSLYYAVFYALPGGLPIALFPDGEDLSGSGSGTPSEDDEVEDGEDDDASNGSWEDIEEEEDV